MKTPCQSISLLFGLLAVLTSLPAVSSARRAFAHAPVEQLRPPDAPRNWKPKKISIPHLRSRAKVYLAMGELESAADDAEQVYLAVNQKAGYISMRTDDLEEAEALREAIRKKRDESGARTE
ncbi:MAG: hypothetical protein VCG02_20395 [Verrucomicrobiota bacterium]